jgi:uncharacterized protein YcfL
MHRCLKPILLATVCTPMLLGCEAAPVAAPADPYGGANYPQIVVLHDLAGDVRVDTPIIVERADAPLKVTVPIRNVTHDDLSIQYHFTFLDRNHLPLKPDHGWQTVELRSSTQVTIEDSAGDTTAVDWRLDLGAPR